MSYPHFVTLGHEDNEETVTLLVRLDDDRDFFPWGDITLAQRDTLQWTGVFDLGLREVPDE